MKLATLKSRTPDGDLAVVWQDGTPERHVEQIRRAGIPVYRDRPRRLGDVASSIERLGRLAGTAEIASTAALARAEAAFVLGREADALALSLEFSLLLGLVLADPQLDHVREVVRRLRG